ncbi:MAG: tRNA threonylcarbamoyladenosine dehydratase [Muribaculaceae bacterium]|nr:tRNA threonylcarbamoyladenosine dehydratase [Muribaculaceae bacterium]
MQNQFSRTQLLLGGAAMQTLKASRVAVFGVGGVGGYAVEVLARSGVGAIDIFDDDRICLTNVNRQIIALTNNIGRYKVDVAEERIHAINPHCKVEKRRMFYLVSNADEVDLSVYDYVVDCIDTVSAKMELIRRCKRLNVPIICSMGAANKLDATAFRVVDITKTMMDPLAKVIRKRLRREGINHFKCVYSPEIPLEPLDDPSISCRFHCICPDKNMRKCTERRNIPASNAWVPATAGLILGGEVVKDLVEAAGTMRQPVEVEEPSDTVGVK